MNKVYADETLPYSQSEKFDIPEDFDPCASTLFSANPDEDSSSAVVIEVQSEEVKNEDGFDNMFE